MRNDHCRCNMFHDSQTAVPGEWWGENLIGGSSREESTDDCLEKFFSKGEQKNWVGAGG